MWYDFSGGGCMKKVRLGVIYGSKSVEHEVSVITALQLMKNADPKTYDVVPIYIDKNGRWLTGEHLKRIESYRHLELIHKNIAYPMLASPDTKETSLTCTDKHEALGSIDVAVVCCHGTLGEDGTVQGLLELAGVPYQGPGVLGSAVCMDKIMTKQVLESMGFPVVKYIWFNAQEWKESKTTVMKRFEALRYPLYVKPSNLGSSVGISRAKDKKGLLYAIDVALHFDTRILVEEEAVGCIEVNASVLGYLHLKVSTLEQPLKTDEILSYADKYERGGKKSGMASLNRRIPAPISSSLTEKIQDAALSVFKTLDLSGVVRIDFLVDAGSEKYWVNEVNTIPGSMSFYLWQATDLDYPHLIDALVKTAFERQSARKGFIKSISSNILAKASY